MRTRLKLLMIVALAAHSASATVVTTGQLATPPSLPASLGAGEYESSSQFWLIPEVTGVVLPMDIPDGVFGGTILAGTRVDAYIVHADPLSAQNAAFAGGATFDNAILGLYVSTSTLDFSDQLAQAFGSPVLTYPTGTSFRGLELSDGCSPCDQYFLSGPNSISFNLGVGGMDQARILVLNPTPEPSAAILLLTGFAAIGVPLYARRRRARS